eukprot:TRINITY_DN7024_c0_g1_i2.p1 TRINITY_DN7024_c0_g1~~TRINITY_DN7024_c0_g1_i2.p1  ORF type:complete len:901 (-),score=161.83 TRINITY_DN7024_c0_g1_i2:31-2733(-)
MAQLGAWAPPAARPEACLPCLRVATSPLPRPLIRCGSVHRRRLSRAGEAAFEGWSAISCVSITLAAVKARHRCGRQKPLSRSCREPGSTENPTEAGPSAEHLEEWVRSVATNLKQLDSIASSSCRGRMPDVSTAAGVAALTRLEELSDDVDMAVAAKSLGQSLGEPSEADKIAMQALVASQLDSDLQSTVLLDHLEDSKTKDTVAEEHLELGARDEDSRGVESLARLLPPCKTDHAAAAQKARLPAITALEQVCQDSWAGLGSSEAAAQATDVDKKIFTGQGRRVSEAPTSLRELLTSAGLQDDASLQVLGEEQTPLLGVVDVPPLVRPGDLLLLKNECLSEEFLMESLADGVARGASAVAVLSDSNTLDAVQVMERFSPDGLKSLVVLPATLPSHLGSSSTASHLAQRFFQPGGAEAASCHLTAVVGGQETEVRTAAWLLSGLLEKQKGACRSGFLSDRRCLLGYGSIQVGRPLTACAVQEMVAGMTEAGVTSCVVEVLPSADLDAFDGLEFDLTVDLGMSENNDLRSKILECTRSGSVVAPADSKTESGSKATFSLTLPQVEEKTRVDKARASDLNSLLAQLSSRTASNKIAATKQLELMYDLPTTRQFVLQHAMKAGKGKDEINKLTKAKILEALQAIGVEIENPTKVKKKDLVEELYQAQTADAGDEEKVDFSDLMEGEFRGRVRRGTGPAGLCLEFEYDRGEVQEKVMLPLLGAPSARAAIAAIAAASVASQEDGQSGFAGSAWTSRLRTLRPPPGTLELVMAPGTWREYGERHDSPEQKATAGKPSQSAFSGRVGVLHEVSTPEELRSALQHVREWLTVDGRESPRISAVFGCEGEVRRGDRAKYAWALADLCEHVVLTTNNPRAELPMQVIEDVLDALQGRKRWAGEIGRAHV